MSKEIALKISNVSKQYRLGVTGASTLSDDLARLWAKIRGKENPFLQVGETNDRTIEGGDYVWALKDINIEVKKGEILGIIGKNGAGKSTLLKLLSKITAPTTGSIKVNGRMASLLEVGTGFHPELTGRENVFLNGAILGMTKKEIAKKIDEIIVFSGCAKFIDTPVKRYSSGMRVRLGFAVAAFLDPDILVVDEVLAVGDAEFQKKAIGKMKDVSSEGKRTVIFVSHNMTSIRNLCQRGIVLKDGSVSFDGDVETAITKYLQLNNSNAATSLQVNIPDSNHLYNTGEAKFLSARIFNCNNEISNKFSFREQLTVSLELEVYKNIENVNLQIAIVNRFSEVVTNAISNGSNYSGTSFSKGIYNINFELPLDLMPGEYALRIAALFNFTGSAIDLVDYFYPFTISKETEDGLFIYPWLTVHGFIEMKNKWNISKIK